MKKRHVMRTILSVALRSMTIYILAKKMTALIKWEANLAEKSLAQIITCLFLLVSLVTFSWLCVCTLVFLYLNCLHFSAISSLLIILLVNILVVVGCCAIACHCKKNYTLRMHSNDLGHSQ